MPREFIFLVPNKPKLTKVQMQTLVDICIGSGLIALGSVTIPAIFDKGTVWSVIFGIVMALASWYTGLIIGGRMKDE